MTLKHLLFIIHLSAFIILLLPACDWFEWEEPGGMVDGDIDSPATDGDVEIDFIVDGDDEPISDSDDDTETICTCFDINDCCDGCLPINESASCNTGLGCTEGTCSSGACEAAPKAGACLINGACYVEFDTEPGNVCHYCDPFTSPTGWRNERNGTDCEDGSICTINEKCAAGECTDTDPLPNDCGDYECGWSNSGCYECGICDSETQVCWENEEHGTKRCAPNKGGDCGDMNGLQEGSPWPMRGGCPTHQGRSPYQGPQHPTMKWAFEVGSSIMSAPVIAADGTVYFGNHNNGYYALNADGTEKWKFSVGTPLYSTSALSSENVLYFSSSHGVLHAIDSTGTEKWQVSFCEYQTFSSPTIDDVGNIYIGSGNPDKDSWRGLTAISSDGNILWTYETAEVVVSSPSIGKNGVIYFGSGSWEVNAGHIYAIDSSGSLLWSRDIGTGVRSTPTIGSDGTIYFGSDSGIIYAFNPNGDEKWRFGDEELFNASPSIGLDGTLYIGTDNGDDQNFLYAITPDGHEKWKIPMPGVIWTDVLIDRDGTLYFGCNDGKLYSYSPDGEQLWAFFTGKHIYTSPVLSADGTLYFGVTGQGMAGSTAPYFLYALGHCDEQAGECINHCGNMAGLQAGAVWPMRGGCPTYQGRSRFAGPNYPTLLWKYDAPMGLYGTPSIGKDHDIYFGTGAPGATEGLMIAVDFNGVEKWRYDAQGGITSSPSLSNDDHIYFGSYDNYLYKLDSDGNEVWTYDAGGDVWKTNLAPDGTVFFGSRGNNLVALNPDGTEKWKESFDNRVGTPSVAPDGTLVAPIGDIRTVGSSIIVGYDQQGLKLWETETSINLTYSGVMSPDNTFNFGGGWTGSDDGWLWAIDINGITRWTYEYQENLGLRPFSITQTGNILATSQDSILYEFDQLGNIVYQSESNFINFTSGSAIDRYRSLYMYKGGYLWRLDENHEMDWSFNLGNGTNNSPVIGPYNTVLAATTSGSLYAIGGFVKIPAGTFVMGSPDGINCPPDVPDCNIADYPAEPGRAEGEIEIQRLVTLTHDFEMSIYETTQQQFETYMGYNPSRFINCGPTCPVEMVNWYESVAYANALSESVGLTPCYAITEIVCKDDVASADGDADTEPQTFDDIHACAERGGIYEASVELNDVDSWFDCEGYRLPNYKEWEYAARAGTRTALYNGDITYTGREPLDPNLDEIGWYGGNSNVSYDGGENCTSWFEGAHLCGSHPVAEKEPNTIGLYDMSGNVWERVGDSTGFGAIIKGGSWQTVALNGRSAARGGAASGDKYSHVGFRLVRTLNPDPDADGIGSDADDSGRVHDHPCSGSQTENCDDNCPYAANPDQADTNGNGVGDACE